MKRILAFVVAINLILSIQTVFAQQEEPNRNSAVLSKPEKETVLSALYEADISYIRTALELRLVTCRELTEYYLERIETYNETYNCFITICSDALEKAAECDARLDAGEAGGALFGVPVVVKDNMDLSGYYTTNGHDFAYSSIADSNADAVDYLLREGAVIIGKTNMSTDAQDARTSYSEAVGETKNAYNTMLASGGSSGGTAVAVSLNFAYAGLGTDTNSSLRIPAALNGCVALRTATGLISISGVVPLNDTRDVAGAVTRTVYDQAVMMDALTEGAYDFAENLDEEALDGARIGVLSELTYPQENSYERTEANIDDEVADTFERAVQDLEGCGAEVVTVSMPDLFQLSEASREDDSSWLKQELYSAFAAILEEERLDAVIFPSYLSAPLKSGVDENGVNWDVSGQVFINNCPELSPSAGLPEITVPIGYHSTGAGIGMEMASLKGGEQLLLDLAYSYTERHSYRQPPEETPDLYAASEDESPWEMIGERVPIVCAVGRMIDADAKPTSRMKADQRLLNYGIVAVCIVIIASGLVVLWRKMMLRTTMPEPTPYAAAISPASTRQEALPKGGTTVIRSVQKKRRPVGRRRARRYYDREAGHMGTSRSEPEPGRKQRKRKK